MKVASEFAKTRFTLTKGIFRNDYVITGSQTYLRYYLCYHGVILSYAGRNYKERFENFVLFNSFTNTSFLHQNSKQAISLTIE